MTISVEVQRPRLVVVRRLYLYTVAFVGLVAIHGNLWSLTQELTNFWISLGGDWLNPLAWPVETILESGSVLLVALLFFVVHWTLIQGYLRGDQAEARSSLRHLFVWLCLVVSFYWFGAGLANFISVPLQMLPGLQAVPARTVLISLPMAMVPLAVAALCVDRFAGICISERNANRTRLVRFIAAGCQLLMSLTCLLLIIGYLHNAAFHLLLPALLGGAVQMGGEPTTWILSGNVAVVLATLLVLTRLEHLRCNRPEAGATTLAAAFRTGYLQAGMFTGVILLFVALGLTLKPLLQPLFTDQLVQPWYLGRVQVLLAVAVTLPIGLACWQLYVWLGRRSPDHKPAAEWAVALPRFRDYALAAVGLTVLSAGTSFILRDLLQGPLAPDLADLDDVVFGVKTRLLPAWFPGSVEDWSWTLASIPLLVAVWQTIGRHARGSSQSILAIVPRRIYLYLVSLVSVLFLLVQSGLILYALLLLWTGGEDTQWEMRLTGIPVAVAVLIWHLVLLRREEDWPAPEPDGDRARTRLDRELASLDREINELTLRRDSLVRQRAELDAAGHGTPEETHE
ncbi:MAG: hypothetical protein F4X16_14280 [Caldilineaceae bacterium SB0661_bin_34]|nr:hypothetical protein [Caldilineaceae bacterium SB0661_bin_34]